MIVNPSDFSEQARIVWEALSARQREEIQGNYPMRATRNSLLCELRHVKVEVQVLSEISGLSRQSVSKILYREAEPDKATIENLKGELKKIQKAVDRLGSHILRLEKLHAG